MSIQSLLNTCAVGGESSDPYFTYNTLLLNGNGTNGAQNNTFVDSSTNNFTITRNGNTNQGTFSPYGSYWCGYNGDGGTLGVPAGLSTEFAGWGGRTRTWECWVYWNGVDASLQNAYAAVAADGRWTITIGSGKLTFGWTTSTGSQTSVSSTASVPANQWVHLCLCVDSTTSSNTTIYLGINGTIETFTGNNLSTQTSSFGWSGMFAYVIYTPWNYEGYFYNLRWSSNVRYTSNYTVPTAPFTNDANTMFLLGEGKRFVDISSNNYTVTNSSVTTIRRGGPFYTSLTGYLKSTIGGSGYFDGTGDQLVTANSELFAFGTGDFTVECWLYATGSNSSVANFSNGQSSNSNFGWEMFLADSTTINFSIIDGTTQYSATSTKFSLNAWNHVAGVRNGNTMTIYVNGVAGGTTATVTGVNSNSPSGATVKVSGYNNGNNVFSGYIGDFRITKGGALYTTTFTPPSAPLTSSVSAGAVSLLLNYTNADIYDNAMMNDLETVGNAQISTSVKKYGTGSIYFDGTGDYLTAPNIPPLALGSKDFTIEAWIYTTAAATTQTICGKETTNNSAWLLHIYNNSGNKIAFNLSSSGSSYGLTLSGTTTLATNTWYHIAAVRSGSGSNNIKLYVNGVQDAQGTFSGTIYNDTSSVTIGYRQPSSNLYFNGYIDDLRITSGVARYTTTFTPPAKALPLKGS